MNEYRVVVRDSAFGARETREYGYDPVQVRAHLESRYGPGNVLQVDPISSGTSVGGLLTGGGLCRPRESWGPPLMG
jgi:hypothetical protein